MHVLVTGAAGFIGFHLSKRLLSEGHSVVGLDNLNDYYDVLLKQKRLEILSDYASFSFIKEDLSHTEAMDALFRKESFSHVVNLAAQAGVRYSLINPKAYVDANLVGFFNILEGCRHTEVSHLVFASSSSVYGLNTQMPFSVHDNVDHPISIYAASKKSNELMAHSYSYLFKVPSTGLRFFTVYGPWGRPDMALFLFTKAILEDKAIDVFNHGKMRRDFTYIDDIIEGVFRVMQRSPVANPDWNSDAPDPSSSVCPYKLYNIGNNNTVELLDFIHAIEHALGKKAQMNLLPLQPGDVPATYANIDDLFNDVGFKPSTEIAFGIQEFIDWYMEYYHEGH
ncbi:MAG: NAD-dependent epimerase [Spirochaetaceae bacterium]|nr:MAG: NAD-dependent epimerase [Spirochaetaceae bacterium]